MSGRIYAIALNTFREAIRRRVLIGIIFAVVGLNLFAIVLGQMSFNEHARITRDFALSGISLFGALTAITLGVLLLYGEIQRRTIHIIICKPLARYEFVVGKYLGMAATLLVLVACFALALVALLALQDVPFTPAIGKAILLSYGEVLVVAAVAIFFSSFSTPYLSGIFTLGVFFVGRSTPELRAGAAGAERGPLATLYDGALYLAPDLHMFSISGGTVGGESVSVHSTFVSWSYVAATLGYGVLYIGVLLCLAAVIFSKRDFV